MGKITTAEELDALPIRERDAWVAAVLRFMRERGYTVTAPGVVPAALAAARVEVERSRGCADSMQHFADVAERVERRNNVLASELAALRDVVGRLSLIHI